MSLKYFDVIVVGAGIAGASTAYFLKKAGLSVVVVEKDTICSGGSNAAGAFLSPKISKPSPYKSYLNRAFLFSTNFYKDNFPHIFNQCGLEKIPLDEYDIKRCLSYEPYIEFNYSKIKDNYFFPDAGIIHPYNLTCELLKECEVKENYTIKEIKQDELWHVDDFTCKHLILATGRDNSLFDIPYIKTKNIAGYRYDVTYDDMQKREYNQHKDLSISSFYNDCIAIGATHIKESEVTNLSLQAKEDSHNLLEKANKLIDMPNLKVIKNYHGYRNATYDYFPIVGKVIDEKQTLKAYPYISHGTKVPSSKYLYRKNLYIHGALAWRGFVYAPYNAKLLTKLIVDNKAIDDRLSTVRLFKKWAIKSS